MRQLIFFLSFFITVTVLLPTQEIVKKVRVDYNIVPFFVLDQSGKAVTDIKNDAKIEKSSIIPSSEIFEVEAKTKKGYSSNIVIINHEIESALLSNN